MKYRRTTYAMENLNRKVMNYKNERVRVFGMASINLSKSFKLQVIFKWQLASLIPSK